MAVAPTARSTAEPKPEDGVAKPPPFKIRSPQRLDRLIKMMVYGVPGVGKTTFVATADDIPSMRDVIYIDAEQGDMSLEDRPELSIVGVQNYNQFSQIYEYLALHCRHRDDNNVDGLRKTESWLRGEDVDVPHRYRTVVVDSLTEVNKMLMYKILNIKPGTTKLNEELNTPEFKEWGQGAESMRLLVRSFRDLPMNTIFVCQEQIIEDDSKRQHRRPALPGKLSMEIMGFMDIVGYLGLAQQTDGTTVRRLYIQPGRTFQAKSRFVGNATTHIENPSLEAVLALSRTENDHQTLETQTDTRS